MIKVISIVLALSLAGAGVAAAAPKAAAAKAAVKKAGPATIDKGLDDLLTGELKAQTKRAKKPVKRYKPISLARSAAKGAAGKGAAKASATAVKVRKHSPAELRKIRQKAKDAEKLLMQGN